MGESVLTQVMLPAVLALIMFGMGLTLTKQDFTRLRQYPFVVIAGLVGQLLVLPILAIAIIAVFELAPVYAIGLIILAACPGGTTSNMISHLARANLALSVTLTAFSTLICVITSPLIIRWALQYYGSDYESNFSLASTTVGLIFITLLPVLLGIAIRAKFELWAKKTEAFFRRLSLSFLIIMIVAILIQERDNLAANYDSVFAATFALNGVAILAGLALAKMTSAPADKVLTLGIEVGIQNASMAMLIAVSFINAPDLAISAGVYGITMYLGTGLLVLWSRLRFPHLRAKTSVSR